MLSIKEYLSKPIEPDNWITIDDFNKLFKSKENGTTIIYLTKNTNEYLQIYYKLWNYINDYDVDNVIIFSNSPDCDFPPPKRNIIEYQDKPYNDNIQYLLDEKIYKDKVETELLDTFPNKIKHIFSHSVGIKNDKITMIPLGHDPKAIPYHNYILKLQNEFINNKINRNILCYYNCTLPPDVIHWYGMIRRNIYQWAINTDFITVEYCKVNPRPLNDELFYNYYNKLVSSKFIICPRGCGIDTYRMWDAIYMGCIPIVEKYEGYNDMTDLPILFVNGPSDYLKLTKEYLETEYDKIINNKYNYNKLHFKYWENKIYNLVDDESKCSS